MCRYENFGVLYFSMSVDMSSLYVNMRICQKAYQSTWAVCWSTWALVKNIYFNLLFFIYFKYYFNKNIYLKHFKHTIKHNMSSLNSLKSSKSSMPTISPFLIMTKPLSLLLIICTIVNKHTIYFWASKYHKI